jgi:hypothetical protein
LIVAALFSYEVPPRAALEKPLFISKMPGNTAIKKKAAIITMLIVFTALRIS